MRHCYMKSAKYPDLSHIYTQCAGPGALKATEYIADKMNIRPGSRILDIGMCYGYQTCFLAKEYGAYVIGIDPAGRAWGDHRPFVDHLMDNASDLGVHDKVLGVETGLPDSKLPSESFDYIYASTTFEMLRGILDGETYRRCLQEAKRVLKPGGIMGIGEPMIKHISVPSDMEAHLPTEWRTCFTTIQKTCNDIELAGFSILDAGYAEDAQLWWNEYAMYNRFHSDEAEEKATIATNDDRWLSYGYVIARK